MATATERDALPHAIRHRFPLLEHQVYLNSCSQGVLSDAVREAYATTCATGTSRARPGSTGWSAPRRRARASPGSSARTTTRSP